VPLLFVLACSAMPLAAQKNRSDSLSSAGISLTRPVAGVSSAGPQNAHSLARAEKVVHIKAAAGDTIAAIAKRWNASPDVLARLNGVASDVELAAGKDIVVPAPPAVRSSKSPRSNKSSERAQPDNVKKCGLTLNDKSIIEAEEIWEDSNGYWYRRDGVAHFVARDRVKSYVPAENKEEQGTNSGGVTAKLVDVNEDQQDSSVQPVWIYLVGGARVEVDEVSETTEGAWYRRGNISIFVEKSRIDRIEREPKQVAAAPGSKRRWSERGWSTGSSRLDNLIRQNGSRFGVDPYLIFCVMEQESHFNSRALSPVGAMGLMQLMPGTAARFGVRRPFEPAANVMGGTRYLKLLLASFKNRVDLVLASYNAGEGAVARYGGRVPPYRETRDYVKKISKQYDRIKPESAEKLAAEQKTQSKLR
jgi:LysM repeat protein